MLDKAQTFPLSLNRLATPQSRHGVWMTAKVNPYSDVTQQRVCYPRLEPWSAEQDGQRQLPGDAKAKLDELKSVDRYLGAKTAFQGKWCANVEGANRGVEGSEAASVPTVMLVMWSESDDECDVEDLKMWEQACGDVVAFLRSRGAAYFAVEVVHYDKLDYGVVNS